MASFSLPLRGRVHSDLVGDARRKARHIPVHPECRRRCRTSDTPVSLLGIVLDGALCNRRMSSAQSAYVAHFTSAVYIPVVAVVYGVPLVVEVCEYNGGAGCLEVDGVQPVLGYGLWGLCTKVDFNSLFFCASLVFIGINSWGLRSRDLARCP